MTLLSLSLFLALILSSCDYHQSDSQTNANPNKDFNVEFLRTDFNNSAKIDAASAKIVLLRKEPWKCRMSLAVDLSTEDKSSQEKPKDSKPADGISKSFEGLADLLSRASYDVKLIFTEENDGLHLQMENVNDSEKENSLTKSDTIKFGSKSAYAQLADKNEKGEPRSFLLAVRRADKRLFFETSYKKSQLEKQEIAAAVPAILSSEKVESEDLYALTYGECR